MQESPLTPLCQRGELSGIITLSSPFRKGGLRGCPTTLLKPAFVILSEAKNLMDSGTYTLEILRLAPQNDVVGQPPEGDFLAFDQFLAVQKRAIPLDPTMALPF